MGPLGGGGGRERSRQQRLDVVEEALERDRRAEDVGDDLVRLAGGGLGGLGFGERGDVGDDHEQAGGGALDPAVRQRVAAAVADQALEQLIDRDLERQQVVSDLIEAEAQRAHRLGRGPGQVGGDVGAGLGLAEPGSRRGRDLAIDLTAQRAGDQRVTRAVEDEAGPGPGRPQRLLAIRDHLRHLVEGPGQLAELVAVRDGHPGPLAALEEAGRGDQAGQRPQHAAPGQDQHRDRDQRAAEDDRDRRRPHDVLTVRADGAVALDPHQRDRLAVEVAQVGPARHHLLGRRRGPDGVVATERDRHPLIDRGRVGERRGRDQGEVERGEPRQPRDPGRIDDVADDQPARHPGQRLVGVADRARRQQHRLAIDEAEPGDRRTVAGGVAQEQRQVGLQPRRRRDQGAGDGVARHRDHRRAVGVHHHEQVPADRRERAEHDVGVDVALVAVGEEGRGVVPVGPVAAAIAELLRHGGDDVAGARDLGDDVASLGVGDAAVHDQPRRDEQAGDQRPDGGHHQQQRLLAQRHDDQRLTPTLTARVGVHCAERPA